MKRNYFLYAAACILILSVIAFSDNLFTNIGQKSNKDPKFVIHGIFWFAWFTMLVIQSNLIRKGEVAKHRQLGMKALYVAMAVTLSTLYIFIVLFEGWDMMNEFTRVNRFFLPTFALMTLLGYLNRTNATKHKRYMYLGTVFTLIPILDRASSRIIFNGDYFLMDMFLIITWNAFFLSCFVYDWLTLRRIHPITYLSFIWFYVVWCIAIFG
jgi:uncharacterized membrane protein YozB (DUF420 family)